MICYLSAKLRHKLLFVKDLNVKFYLDFFHKMQVLLKIFNIFYALSGGSFCSFLLDQK